MKQLYHVVVTFIEWILFSMQAYFSRNISKVPCVACHRDFITILHLLTLMGKMTLSSFEIWKCRINRKNRHTWNSHMRDYKFNCILTQTEITNFCYQKLSIEHVHIYEISLIMTRGYHPLIGPEPKAHLKRVGLR